MIMFYDFFTKKITGMQAIKAIAWELGTSLIPDPYKALDFFLNFVDNVKLMLGGNPSATEIARIIPDFAFLIIRMVPGASIAKVIANAWPIATIA